MKIAYFVHDLNDAAVLRRVHMWTSASDIAVLGFRRAPAAPAAVGGRQVVDLGQTHDASFRQRIGAVLRALWRLRALRPALAGSDVVVARQLETLLIAALARRYARADAKLVYECLDINRLMLRRDPAGWALRALERALMRRCSALITSSPAFIAEYFVRRQRHFPPPLLLENKVLHSDLAAPAWRAIAQCRTLEGGARAPGPWRIGWFGVLRCRRSLHMLAALACALPGQVEVILRGRPARHELPDFDSAVSAAGLRFAGPYNRATDLADIYQGVDFTWAIDFFEAGGNSDWLLPNRLYEGTLFGCVPIALRGVATGHWLAQHGAGVLLDDADGALAAFFRSLTVPAYAAARRQVRQIPLHALSDDAAACTQATTALLDTENLSAKYNL